MTCGVQYPQDAARTHCSICEDERQYVGYDGQQWTSLNDMRRDGYSVDIREEVPGLWGLATSPTFAIGQRALLVPGEGGNVLWDCISYIDDAAAQRVTELGGISAIALSHPHYYSSMTQWSRAFDDAPIYVHERDAQWVPRTDNVVFWSGDTNEILPGRTLINAGVHFAGGTVMHWADGVDGRGALCAGDIFTVVADRRWVGFMYSYPNLIPEHPDTIRRAVELVRPYAFESLYGAWWDRIITHDAHAAVFRSARRYFDHIGTPIDGI
ncbi:MBL fold metallo-hydrolase [Rhodococcoides kyotonense]|uniref:MBL fold metallo-hydrolase n=1 Tax=Rhodococcoides kyotonense TaxID=398843 RepID=UPI001FE94DC5|nr:MBL fold metallo-hydrolase [Rhodococcus kyotonensis]